MTAERRKKELTKNFIFIFVQIDVLLNDTNCLAFCLDYYD